MVKSQTLFVIILHTDALYKSSAANRRRMAPVSYTHLDVYKRQGFVT